MRFKALAFIAALLLTAIVLSPVQAAPQILGLMATSAPVPMTCGGGICTAELSAVCLQEHRPTPPTGTAYRPAKSTEIILAVSGPNGVDRQRRIEAALSFTSLRQYTAVKVSLPEEAVRRLGAGTAKLTVAPMASIIPVALDNDPDPLSASEIARYIGPLRVAAERAFQRDSDRVNATDILNRMVNRLPDHSDAGIEMMGSLWQQTIGKDITAGAQAFMKRAVENCRETLRIGVQPDLRSCLSYEHDYLAGENTNIGWQAMKPGS